MSTFYRVDFVYDADGTRHIKRVPIEQEYNGAGYHFSKFSICTTESRRESRFSDFRGTTVQLRQRRFECFAPLLLGEDGPVLNKVRK